MKYLTIAVVAERLDVDRKTVTDLIDRGELVAIKLSDGRRGAVRIEERSFDDYVVRRKVKPKAARATA